MTDAGVWYTALSGVGKAYGAEEAGKSNAAIQHFNADQDRIQAQQVLETGKAQGARQDIKAHILRGEQTAGYAGQGVLVNAGTARSVVAGSEAVSAMDKLMISVNARRQAYGFQVAAANSDFQAHLARVQGNEAAIGALTEAGAKANAQYKAAHPDAPPFEEDNNAAYQEDKARRQSLLADESTAGDYNGPMNYGPNLAFT